MTISSTRTKSCAILKHENEILCYFDGIGINATNSRSYGGWLSYAFMFLMFLDRFTPTVQKNYQVANGEYNSLCNSCAEGDERRFLYHGELTKCPFPMLLGSPSLLTLFRTLQLASLLSSTTLPTCQTSKSNK